MAFNLTRAAATIAGASARRITLHLPDSWPWKTAYTTLFDQSFGPPQPTPI